MLRGIAVALVCLCHAGVPFFPGGFIGVDVFFVLSGYLITGLLVCEVAQRGSINYGAFLARRLRRLLPALAVMILLVLVSAAMLLSTFEFRSQTGAAAYAALWSSNLFFALRDLDYFSALEAEDLFLHTWSLGVEEQFYLLWPLIIAATMRVILRRNDFAARTYQRLALCFGLMAVLSFALSMVWTATQPLWAFYMMPSRVWQFALGGLVFLLASRSDRKTGRSGSDQGAALLGITIILVSSALFDADFVYPGCWALLPSIGTALVLLGKPPSNSAPVKAGTLSRGLVWLGDRSYSIYLWHWPVLILSSAFVVEASMLSGGIALLVSVLLGSCSYRFIELPFWRGRLSRSRGRTVAVASLATIGAVSLAAMSAAIVGPGPSETATFSDAYDPRQDAPPIYLSGMRCDTGHLDAGLEPCTIGADDSTHTAVLFGDSIGAQWVSMLPAIFNQPNWQIVVLTKSACPIVDEDYVYARAGGVYRVCARWRQSALEYIEGLKPDIVFIGSDAYYPFEDLQWIDGSRRIFDRLSNAADDLVVMPGTPKLGFDGPSCLEEPGRFVHRTADSDRRCAVRLRDSTVLNVSALLRGVASEFANVHELSLLDVVCPDGMCAARSITNRVVFRDDKHITDSFVLSQVPEITSRLEALSVLP
ncbi:MAG: acyltransferase family protein [Pseudomonadota bacterium]